MRADEALETAEQRLDDLVSTLDVAATSHAPDTSDADGNGNGEFRARVTVLCHSRALPASVAEILLDIAQLLSARAGRTRARRHTRQRHAKLALAYAFRASEILRAHIETNAALWLSSHLQVGSMLTLMNEPSSAIAYYEAVLTDIAAHQRRGTLANHATAAAAVRSAVRDSRAKILEQLRTVNILKDPEAVAEAGLSSPLKVGTARSVGKGRIANFAESLNIPPERLSFKVMSPENRDRLPQGTLVDKLVQVHATLSPHVNVRPSRAHEEGGGAAVPVRSDHEEVLIELVKERVLRRRGGYRLSVGSWNIRATRREHGIRAPAPGLITDKPVPGERRCIGALLPKLSRIHSLVATHNMALVALQECPGLSVDPSLTVWRQFLRELRNPSADAQRSVTRELFADNNREGHSHQVAWTLTHGEAMAFLYDPDVVEPFAVDASGRCCGVLLKDAVTSRVAITPIQTAREWRAVWPHLSPVEQMRRLFDEARLQLEQAELLEQQWLASQGTPATTGSEDVALASPGLPALLSADFASVLDNDNEVDDDASDANDPQSNAGGSDANGSGGGGAALKDEKPEDVWFKRPPAVSVFRCKDPACSDDLVALVSVHLKAGGEDTTKGEARLLAAAVQPVEDLLARNGGGLVLVLGDFNLAAPEAVKSACASGDAFDPLLSAGYSIQLRNEDSTLATNVDRLVSANTGRRHYDNCFVKEVPAASAGGDGDQHPPSRWLATTDVLLDDVYDGCADGFVAARQAAVGAIEALGGADTQNAGHTEGGVDKVSALRDVMKFFAKPADGRQGKLANTFNNYVFNTFSDHKALAVSLVRSNE